MGAINFGIWTKMADEISTLALGDVVNFDPLDGYNRVKNARRKYKIIISSMVMFVGIVILIFFDMNLSTKFMFWFLLSPLIVAPVYLILKANLNRLYMNAFILPLINRHYPNLNFSPRPEISREDFLSHEVIQGLGALSADFEFYGDIDGIVMRIFVISYNGLYQFKGLYIEAQFDKFVTDTIYIYDEDMPGKVVRFGSLYLGNLAFSNTFRVYAYVSDEKYVKDILTPNFMNAMVEAKSRCQSISAVIKNDKIFIYQNFYDEQNLTRMLFKTDFADKREFSEIEREVRQIFDFVQILRQS